MVWLDALVAVWVTVTSVFDFFISCSHHFFLVVARLRVICVAYDAVIAAVISILVDGVIFLKGI